MLFPRGLIGNNELVLQGAFVARLLDFLDDRITSKATGADFEGNRGPLKLGLYLDQIGLPGTAGTIFRMAYLVAGDSVLSAYIAGP
jgi:tRNA G18 (ribose-2'-O)-methylase SpoU